MVTKQIQHAIIGCGRIAQNHFNAAVENNMQVHFCIDKDIRKAEDFASKNRISNFSANYMDLINSDVDSVSICTDHFSHLKIAKDICEHKHLIIEKPFSFDYQDAVNFFRYKATSKNVITVVSQHRFDSVVLFVKKLLEDKVLGDIIVVNLNLKCHKDASYYIDSYWRGSLIFEGGSVVINQAYHLIDLLNFYFGLPLSVKSFVKNIKSKGVIETEDTCVSIMDYGGFLCNFYATSLSTTEWETQFEIVGTNGELSFSIDFPENLIYLRINDNKKCKYKNEIERVYEHYNVNKNSNVNYYGKSHIEQFKNFKKAILGQESLKVSVKDALNTQKLVSLIYNNG